MTADDIMIEHDDIRTIVNDLELLRLKHEKEEKYELCQTIAGYTEKLLGYLSGRYEYELIIETIYKVCYSQYEILRLIEHEGKCYVAFVIPSLKPVCFYIQNTTDKDSPLWAELNEKYNATTQSLINVIQETE